MTYYVAKSKPSHSASIVFINSFESNQIIAETSPGTLGNGSPWLKFQFHTADESFATFTTQTHRDTSCSGQFGTCATGEIRGRNRIKQICRRVNSYENSCRRRQWRASRFANRVWQTSDDYDVALRSPGRMHSRAATSLIALAVNT